MIYVEKNREIYLKHLSEVIPDYDTFVGIQNYLDGTDFFTAPCSTKYHLSVEGGLCQHHLNVEENIIKDKIRQSCQLGSNTALQVNSMNVLKTPNF